MPVPGGLEVFLVPALFLLAFIGLAGKFVLKWVREGFDEEVTENQSE